MRPLSCLGAATWAQYDELRHTAAVIGTVLYRSVRPQSWAGLDYHTRALDNLIIRSDQIAAGLQEGKGTAGRILTDSSSANEFEALLGKTQAFMDNLNITLSTLQ